MKKTWKLGLIEAHANTKLLGLEDVLQISNKWILCALVSFSDFVTKSNCLQLDDEGLNGDEETSRINELD